MLVSNGYYENGGIKVIDGVIQSVGCLSVPDDAVVIYCAGQIVSPGLINAHDHLSYNQNPPGGLNNSMYEYCNDPENIFADPSCIPYRYDRRNQWRRGLDGKVQIEYSSVDKKYKYEQITWNELRHIIAGTTTVAGSGGSKGY